MFFRHSVSFSGMRPETSDNLHLWVRPGRPAFPASHSHLSLPHPRSFTRSPWLLVCVAWGHAVPAAFPAPGDTQGLRQAGAAGRAGRAAQEAPAPEVTALLSDPSHIRWLPCLPWQQAPAAPSGCHWRAAPPLFFFFFSREKKRPLI